MCTTGDTNRHDSDSKCTGREGERLALDYLRGQGLAPVASNFRSRFGEIDIIMQAPDQTLVFIEVRVRKSDTYGGARASVDLRKRRKLAATAEIFLKAHPKWAHYPCRFDVVAITGPATDAHVEWLRAAFDA